MSGQKAHAKLGASTSEIWLNCAGAPNLWEEAPEKPESPYANEGTEAHELLEAWLKGGSKVNKGYPTDMVRAVGFCVKKIQTLNAPELLVEKRVTLERLVAPDMFGTVDIGAIWYFNRLDVTDYKHGSGVKVDVVKEYAGGRRVLNTQLVYYALGLADEFDFHFKEVTLRIVQPRCKVGSPSSEVTVSMSELKSYIDYFKRGVEDTMKPNAKRSAGPWCRFCKAKPICKEGQGTYRTDVRGDFE